jgi:hypothetical protein
LWHSQIGAATGDSRKRSLSRNGRFSEIVDWVGAKLRRAIMAHDERKPSVDTNPPRGKNLDLFISLAGKHHPGFLPDHRTTMKNTNN